VRADARTRWLDAAVALLLGVAFSFAIYHWLPPYTNPSPGQTRIWVLTSIPFAGLAVLLAAGVRRSVGALGWIALAALTVLAYANLWWQWGVNSATVPLGFQVFYGVIVLGHVLRFRGRPPRPAETIASTHPNGKAARRYGLILIVATVIASLPCFMPWSDGTDSVVAFCVAVIAPLWLSAAFVFVQWARDRAGRWAATAWLAATILCLPLLFFGVLLSHLSFPSPE
jgi:hypothetical protein